MADADHAVEWRAVLDFPCYEVSRTGFVRRIAASGHARSGDHRNSLPYVLKLGVSSNGYYSVFLCQNGKGVRKTISRLVLEAFSGKPPTSLHQAAHRNGVRTDNRLENLYWATVQENHNDKRRHGTMARGEKIHQSKLTANKVIDLRASYARGGISQRALAQEFGVSQAVVHRIVTRAVWKHIK